jgi:hypothetical protein
MKGRTPAARRAHVQEQGGGSHRPVGKSDGKKKQIPLRLSEKLYAELAAWAEADFRSINGQIEYLLTECVKKRKKK